MDFLRLLWNSLNLAEKVRNNTVTFEPQPRYLTRPLTQVGIVRLRNGWAIGIAHRWRDTPNMEWSLPDPKRIWLEQVAFYCI